MPDWCLPKAIRVGVAVAFLVAGAIVGGIAIGLYGEKNQGAKTRQAIAIDANSNSTTFYLYNWDRDDIFDDANDYRKMAYIDMVESYTIYESVDDLSSYDDIESLIDRGINYIFNMHFNVEHDSKEVKKTKEYFRATGEIRAEKELFQTNSHSDNGPNPDSILDDVRWALSRTYVRFDDEVADVNFLSGDEEGKFGWIAVNNLKEHFEQKEQKDPSFATLDMGGSSTQLSYESNVESDDTQHVWVYGETYNITTDSKICYGIEESMRRFVALLVQESYFENGDFRPILNNPCMSFETKSTQQAMEFPMLPTFQTIKEDIFNHACTEMLNRTFAFALSQVSNGYPFVMKPSYNKEGCDRILSILIEEDPEACKASFEKGDCFNSTEVSKPEGNFVAFNSYYSEFAKILDLTPEEGLSEIETKVEALCSQSSPNGNTETDCFKTTFILKLLRDGYGFDEITFKNIEFAESLNEEEISWTSGQILTESTDLESCGSCFSWRKMTFWEFILTLLTGCILFVAGLAQLALIYIFQC